MAWYEFCEKLPYTISIQFNKCSLSFLSEDIHYVKLNNRISNHISIKYLGYEDDLTSEKLLVILNKLYSNRSNFIKKDIEVMGFEIMNNLNPHFQNLLYLKVGPKEFLYDLHHKIICLLNGIIDLYRLHDFENFIPHISCGKIEDNSVLNYLNRKFNKYGKIYIKDWYLVLHTSKREYIIC